jgi:arsenite methyltransferase
MTTTMPSALSRALELLADPPTPPDVSKGYLDLLGGRPTDVPKNTGAVQKVYASSLGSLFFDYAQVLMRKLLTATQHPTEWLNIPQGGVALDVGCGPGNVAASLADAAGPYGLGLGLDIAEPMLARAVRAYSRPNVGFLRADAQRLPLRDDTVDAVVSIAVLQLVPDPASAVAEFGRVLRPGGRLALLVPTSDHPSRYSWLFPSAGARFFGDDELGDLLEDLGFLGVRTKNFGHLQWVRGKRAS